MPHYYGVVKWLSDVNDMAFLAARMERTYLFIGSRSVRERTSCERVSMSALTS
jgi:hypothetical protein